MLMRFGIIWLSCFKVKLVSNFNWKKLVNLLNCELVGFYLVKGFDLL